MVPAILNPGGNVWRTERAHRAAVLIDGAAFFRAVREAFLKARHSIFVIGWDIDSRTRLIGESVPDDGFPLGLAEFLTELVRRRPQLRINLLLWDYSILYAGERELFPSLSLQWQTPDAITLCLDDAVPFGCSQHQKIIVVDDALAFSGGLDLTIRRWDTSEHAAEHAFRKDPAGEPYRPFHDVQMMVDGAAACALAEIVRRRWARATTPQGVPQACDGAGTRAGDPWPPSVQPDFSEVDVGIARTLPPCDGEPAVREVEALFLDSIDAAERTIYIENQYATAPAIAARLARRLRLRPELEVLIVMPGEQHSWIEARAMRNGLIRFKRALDRAGGRRVRMVHPTVAGGIPTMVHSKVMIVDDRLLRVGSANLNNRSMGADSECDLAVEAKSADQRRAVLAVRHRLIADHCGVDPAAVARGLARGHSLLRLIDELRGNGHCLRAVDFGVPDDGGLAAAIEQVADPKRPLRLATLWRAFARHLPGMPRNSAFAVAIAALIVLALALAWNVTPLSALAEPGAAREALGRVAGSSLAALAVLAAFVVGGLVAFPVLILIAATAATFGPWLGFAYSLMGVLASALLTYAIGARYGQQALRRLLGERLDRIRARIVRQGVLAVAAIRVVPLAPFTVVNLVAGASAVRLVDYVAGTLLGMLPGLIAMAVLGNRLADVMRNPSMVEFALLAMVAIVWIGLSFAVQLLLSRAGSRAP